MRKYFFRYFLGIFSITVVTLIIQTVFLLNRYKSSEADWQHGTYRMLVDYVENSLADTGVIADPAGLFETYRDDRISGIIIKDGAGDIVSAVGKSPMGVPLPEPPGRYASMPSGKMREKRIEETVFRIADGVVEKQYGSTTVSVGEAGPGSYIKDVFGRIVVQTDSQTLFSAELLIFTPMTYGNSMGVIRSCLKSLIISVPVCLVFALLAAWYISSRNTKCIADINRALERLAQGENGITIGKNFSSELEEIASAVNNLDGALAAAKRSRSAWLNSISHDLNTPAAAVKMIVDGINDGIFPADEKILHSLAAEIDGLIERIRRVIDYSSLQGMTNLKQTGTDSTAFAGEVVSGSGIADRVTAHVNTPLLFCNISWMSRACIELVKNAGQATDKDVNLYMDRKEESGAAVYSIRVVNEGFFPRNTEGSSLLEPWTRGDFARNGNGNGLGLAIASSVASLHGGKVCLKQMENLVVAEITWPDKSHVSTSSN